LAASNDNVALMDALFDTSAEIEHEGSSIYGGPRACPGRWLWALDKLAVRGRAQCPNP
jgi:uncharacterized protein